jgi:Protein of unknown function (DUF2934)
MADELIVPHPAIPQPTKEQIEHRAYEIYLARGGEHGSDLSDWIAAEQELKAVPLNEPTSRTSTKPDRAQIASRSD